MSCSRTQRRDACEAGTPQVITHQLRVKHSTTALLSIWPEHRNKILMIYVYLKESRIKMQLNISKGRGWSLDESNNHITNLELLKIFYAFLFCGWHA